MPKVDKETGKLFGMTPKQTGDIVFTGAGATAGGLKGLRFAKGVRAISDIMGKMQLPEEEARKFLPKPTKAMMWLGKRKLRYLVPLILALGGAAVGKAISSVLPYKERFGKEAGTSKGSPFFSYQQSKERKTEAYAVGFMHGLQKRAKEEKQPSLRQSIFRGGIASAAGTLPQYAYLKAYTRLPRIVEPELFNKMINQAKAKGLISELAHAGLLAPETAYAFLPKTKTLVTPYMINPGYLADIGAVAHELGHAKQKFLQGRFGVFSRGAYHSGKFIPGIAGLVAGYAPSESTGRKAAILGTLSSLPILGTEAQASYKGMRMLRKAGLPFLKRIHAFKGLPTYLAAAAIPAATYGIKRLLGGYRTEPK